MMETLCCSINILNMWKDAHEILNAMCEVVCQQAKEKLMILQEGFQLIMADQSRDAATQVVHGSARDDTGTGSLMAEHPAAGVAGRDHDEPLGKIADNLDSSIAPQEHEVIPVSIEPLPNEDVVSSDCDVGVVFERNETDHLPRQVSDPRFTFALRLTEEAVARITSRTTDLPRNPFQPMQIGRDDLIIEPIEINVFHVDTGAGSLMRERPTAGVAGRDHDEPLGNGVTNSLASDAGQIANKLDSSIAPQEHEVIPVSIEPLPNEDVMSSDCDVGVVFERNETDHPPRQVSDPWLLETYSTFALRLTEEAIARITSHTTDLPRNPFQPMQIGREDLIIEPMEINVFRLDGAEVLFN